MKTSRLLQAGVVTLSLVLVVIGGIWLVRSGPQEADAGQQPAENKYTAENKNHQRLMECYETALRMDEQRVQALSELDPNVNPTPADPAEEAKTQTQPQAPAAPLLKVESVGMSDDGFYALVNGSLVHEEDMVEGYKVKRIRQNTVELEKDGQVLVLFMN